MKKIPVVAWVANTVAAALILSAVIFAYAMFSPVDVLQNWTTKTQEPSYKTGDTVSIISHFEKVRDVDGVASRFLECRNKQGSYTQYPLTQTQASRASGRGNTIITVKLPLAVSELPTSCRVAIVVQYKIYSFRTHLERSSTNSFTLESSKILPSTDKSPPLDTNVTQLPQASIYPTTQPPQPTVAALSPAVQSDAEDIEHPEEKNEPTETPNLIHRLLDNLFNVINKIL